MCLPLGAGKRSLIKDVPLELYDDTEIVSSRVLDAV